MSRFGLAAIGVALLQTACSLAPAINADIIDYFRVNDLASNRIILLNILRAKDGAPLHFSELSQVRGQLSLGASVSSTFPFGAIGHATSAPRKLATASMTVGTAPSFDVVSLDKQDFTKGVMAPITPATARFFLNEGLDYKMVMILLAAGIRLAGNSEAILNAPNSSRDVCHDRVLNRNEMPHGYRIITKSEPCTGTREPEFYGFLRIVNNMGRVYAADWHEQRLVGPPFKLDMAKQFHDVAMIDPAKYSLSRLPSGEYQLAATSHADTTALCREPRNGSAPSVVSMFATDGQTTSAIPNVACVSGAAMDRSQHDAVPKVNVGTTPGTFVIQLRSTLETIRYVGEILAFQENESARYHTERCVTLDFGSLDHPTCNGGILFRLNRPLQDAGIGIEYGSQYWSLPEPKTCTDVLNCDHTLETMAMISLLLNQNKSGKDIPSTPAVQAVP